jgi:predicted KAP-like P-loop ATPase
MTSYFNDSPIETQEDDRYGVTPFANALAKSIVGIQKPIGTTIALNGPWGSGKSSAVNLVRTALAKEENSNLTINDFKCWWYRGEEALALAFLQDLNSLLKKKLGDKVKDIVPKLTQRLLQAGPVLGAAVTLASGTPLTGLFSSAASFAKRFFPEGDTVEGTFRKLAKILAEQEQRFLIIIDDIDRLSPDEALAIFRLVKSVGQLPNVIYLLVFDRQLADKAVELKYPSEGPHFLEKIIQASFEIPPPLQTDLNNAMLVAIENTCGSPPEDEVTRFMNLFYDAVAPYASSPRHVVRFKNAISVTWPAIADEVSKADFIALEMIRLYEPGLFQAIQKNKERICGVRDRNEGNDEARFNKLLADVPEERRETAKQALQRLFPRLENMGYGSEWIQSWDSERRICVSAHFDTYFRLSLSDARLPAAVIEELIARSNDADYIKETFIGASETVRPNGSTLIPVYLDELTTHAKKVAKENVGTLIKALFEIHDQVDRPSDKERGFMAIANTSLRYHWFIRRLTNDRFTIEERSALYADAVQTASIGWLVGFVSSAVDDYSEREGRARRPEDCLTDQATANNLKDLALRKIRDAAGNNSLLSHADLIGILYRWKDFVGSPEEPKAWTDALLTNKEALVTFARSMTSQSWSQTMGDAVSRATTVAQIRDDSEIFDAPRLRRELERLLVENDLMAEERADVQAFMDAWNRPDRFRG